jgi:ABC-2 type transport system ATP-binding protein
VALAPQELGVYLSLTVRENLRYFGLLAGLRANALARRIIEVADSLALGDLLERRLSACSGGERRRVHTGMALIRDAPLLLLDEPTAGVDVETRNRLLGLVGELAGSGVGICYTTHYLPEVEAIGASVAIIERGGIVTRGAVHELVAKAGSMLEIRLDGGVPPALGAWPASEIDGDTVRIRTDAPGRDLSRAIAALGDASSAVRSVEIVQPSLESVYLAMTGRRYAEDGTAEEP